MYLFIVNFFEFTTINIGSKTIYYVKFNMIFVLCVYIKITDLHRVSASRRIRLGSVKTYIYIMQKGLDSTTHPR